MDTERREKDRERRRRLLAGAVALVTSAGLLVGGLFNSPAALVEEDELRPTVLCADDDDDSGDDAEEELEETEEEEEETAVRPGARARLRQRILQLPPAIRLLVILPLWCVGWLLSSGAQLLWGALLSPLLGKALLWLLWLGLLAAAFLLAGKTVFPELPIRKILNRRSLLGLVLGALLLGVADLVAPLVWVDYSRIEAIARAVGTLLLLSAVTLSFVLRQQRRRRTAAAAAAPEPEVPAPAPAPYTREEILALADSVSRK